MWFEHFKFPFYARHKLKVKSCGFTGQRKNSMLICFLLVFFFLCEREVPGYI